MIWLGDEFTYFGMSYYLQDKIAANLYGIFDTENKNIKNFFQNQKLVNLKKLWSYQENISKMKSVPDLDYLSTFEEKYKIDIWEIAYTERYFYQKYNPYYKFSKNEILSILE